MTILSHEIFWAILLAGITMGNSSAPSALIGRWGGDRVTLLVTAEQGRLGLDCGAGSFPGPITINKNGKFSGQGVFETYRTVPTHPEAESGAVRASFTGRVKGDSLALDVASVDGKDRRHYELTRNRRTKLVRCL